MPTVPCPECGKPASTQTYTTTRDGKTYEVTQYDCVNTDRRKKWNNGHKIKEGSHRPAKVERLLEDDVKKENCPGCPRRGPCPICHPIEHARAKEKQQKPPEVVQCTGFEEQRVALTVTRPKALEEIAVALDPPPAPFPDALPGFRYPGLDQLMQLTHEGREAFIKLVRQASNVAEFKETYERHLSEFVKLEAEFKSLHLSS